MRYYLEETKIVEYLLYGLMDVYDENPLMRINYFSSNNQVVLKLMCTLLTQEEPKYKEIREKSGDIANLHSLYRNFLIGDVYQEGIKLITKLNEERNSSFFLKVTENINILNPNSMDTSK